MKKYETLKKELEKLNELEFIANLKRIANNEAVNNLEALTKKEAMYLLQYEQFEKAFTNKKYAMTLDINYEAFKSTEIVYHISSMIDSANKRILHFYSHDSYIDIVFSSNKATLAKLEYIDSLNNQNFDIRHKRDTKKQTIKETKLARVDFDDIVKAVDFAKLILETSIADLQKMSEAKQSEE